VDDTVCEKTKPSSQAIFGMQGAGFHHSHTKGKRVWGHERVEQTLRCGGVIFPYQFQRYESKQESKIQIACNLLKTLPNCSLPRYLLIDSCYPAQELLETALQTGNHVISGIKTNRIIYPYGIRQSIKDFAKHVRKEETDLVTVGHSSYYVYRYEGKLNMIENAIVLLCWEATNLMTSENMRAFLSTDVSLSNKQIMQYYSKRWAVETYFRTMKVNLSLNRYQVRSTKALDRLWKLLNCSATICMLIEKSSLTVSIHQWQKKTKNSWIEFIYTAAKAEESLNMIQKQLQAA
ncbi:transposase, partial [Bacillus thuringiensis]|uniref:transposase n=1 Tax=Bacillus thuringiensis TaxID=1428 RepID=UPI0034582849